MKLLPCGGSRTAREWSEGFHCIHRALQKWKWNSKAARVARNSIISAPEKAKKRQRLESDERERMAFLVCRHMPLVTGANLRMICADVSTLRISLREETPYCRDVSDCGD